MCLVHIVNIITSEAAIQEVERVYKSFRPAAWKGRMKQVLFPTAFIDWLWQLTSAEPHQGSSLLWH